MDMGIGELMSYRRLSWKDKLISLIFLGWWYKITKARRRMDRPLIDFSCFMEIFWDQETKT